MSAVSSGPSQPVGTTVTGAAINPGAGQAHFPAEGPELVGEVPGTPGFERGLRCYAVCKWEPAQAGTPNFWCTPHVLLRSPDGSAPQYDARGAVAAAAPGSSLASYDPPKTTTDRGGHERVLAARRPAEELVLRAARRALVLEHALRTLNASHFLDERELTDARAMAAVLEVMRK